MLSIRDGIACLEESASEQPLVREDRKLPAFEEVAEGAGSRNRLKWALNHTCCTCFRDRKFPCRRRRGAVLGLPRPAGPWHLLPVHLCLWWGTVPPPWPGGSASWRFQGFASLCRRRPRYVDNDESKHVRFVPNLYFSSCVPEGLDAGTTRCNQLDVGRSAVGCMAGCLRP